MAYTAEISRSAPACFVFLIDQSTSMNEAAAAAEAADGAQLKMNVVADALNRLLNGLVYRCVRDAQVRDLFHIAVIGYGRYVGPILGGALDNREMVTSSELAHNPARLERRRMRTPGGAEYEEEVPVWVSPLANGDTPMARAIGVAATMLEGWVESHAKSFPPIVLNLTDGQPTDKNVVESAQRLRSIQTSDGPALLFNLHIADHGSTPVRYPASAEGLGPAGRLLFDLSSPLPDMMRSYAAELRVPVEEGSRGFVYNADISTLVHFLDIGTRPAGGWNGGL